MRSDLPRMSLEELGSIRVTSVSRAPEELGNAAASIYVITREEILRSGATTLTDALGLAPNLAIQQLGSSNFVASARGFGGRPDTQSFSNKLLLLIDGRSVYSPLFSGIYLDSQDVLLSDVSRIEVIDGPGAALWGANAVNGVINVITQPSCLTTGPQVRAAGGIRERLLSARLGGSPAKDLTYRVYGKAYQSDALQLGDGSSAEDGWHRGQAGFRIDLDRPLSMTTLQGDAYAGANDKAGPGSQSLNGANLLARWERRLDNGNLQLQGYFDHVQRAAPVDGVRFVVHTRDAELQHSSLLGRRHHLVWGAGARLYSYHIRNSESLLFEPAQDRLHIWNLFAQDTLSLTPDLRLTLGMKVEHNSFNGWEPQPEARLAWQTGDSTVLWTAVSRASRSPTPFDTDVVEKVDGTVLLQGNPDFHSETVWSYETGLRSTVSSAMSLSVSLFYSDYDDLRTIELSAPPTFLPLRWDNQMEGHTYGATAWATWQVNERWRLAPGIALLHQRLRQKPEASELLDESQNSNDPTVRAQLTSSFDLGANRSVDLMLRYVGDLPEPEMSSFTELSARFAWRVSAAWELSLRGINLLHKRHLEYPAPAGIPVGRSVLAEARWSP